TLGDVLLELRVLVANGAVERARLQQILNAQHDLGGIERLEQEILDATGQGTAPGVRVRVSGQHHHRQITGAEVRANRVEHGEAIELRHVQIEQHQVGRPRVHQRDADGGIGGAVDVDEA